MSKNSKLYNLPSNRLKMIVHGAGFVGAMSIAEPTTVLPLIVSHLTDSNLLVGLFSSLLKGGAIFFQFYAAFHARGFERVICATRLVFLVRFISWMLMGASLYFFYDEPKLALLFFGLALFMFSSVAGFGVIYYQELLGKSFDKKYRGETIAVRQFFSGAVSIISGGITAWILNTYAAPLSFSYLFLLSGLVMGISFIVLGTFKEPIKEHPEKTTGSLLNFTLSTLQLLKVDKYLGRQVISRVFAYTILMLTPFFILQAQQQLHLSGTQIGSIIALQMLGAMLSNFLWRWLTRLGLNKRIVNLSFLFQIIAIVLGLTAVNIEMYYALFFLLGIASDGFKLAYSNLVLSLAPEKLRIQYIAAQNNIFALALFLSLPGGLLIDWVGFMWLSVGVLLLMVIGFFYSFTLKEA